MSDGNHMFEKVLAFHRKHGHAAPDKFTPMSRELAEFRLKLMLEELTELADALGFRLSSRLDCAWPLEKLQIDWGKVLDGASDLLYVVLGTHVAMGIRDSRFFDEVHRSNMTKPAKDTTGALGKPDKDCGYEEPRIQCLLDRMRRSG